MDLGHNVPLFHDLFSGEDAHKYCFARACQYNGVCFAWANPVPNDFLLACKAALGSRLVLLRQYGAKLRLLVLVGEELRLTVSIFRKFHLSKHNR